MTDLEIILLGCVIYLVIGVVALVWIVTDD